MKKSSNSVNSWVLPAAGCFLLTAFCCPPAAHAQGVQWRHDYNSARREAHEKGRALFLDFGTDNCYWCRRLDETTFQNPSIQRILNEQFIPIKVNASRSTFLAEALQIQAYPTIVLAATDGKILHTLEGYQDAARLNDLLQRAAVTSQTPESMTRDYEEAVRAVNTADHPRAIALLKRVTEDGRDRPVQLKARQLLGEIEAKETVRLGNVNPASAPTRTIDDRTRRARELLTQAREDFRANQFLSCIDRCETITATFADLPEAAEAAQLLAEVRSNPESMHRACAALSDRLGTMYLSLAESCVAKGQFQQAQSYFERVLQTSPGTRSAETARARMAQVNAKPAP
jgi:thioredoxin-related protein